MNSYQDLLEDYLFHHVLSPKTEENYRMCITRLSNALGSDIENLSFSRLVEWRHRELRRGLSPISWNTYIRHLKVLFNHGIKQEGFFYEENPFSRLFVRAPDKLKKRLSQDQVSKVRYLLNYLNVMGGHHFPGITPIWFWRIVFETFFYTGIRRRQLLHILTHDIDLKSLLLHIRFEGAKNKRERFLPIPDDLAPWLEQLLQANQKKLVKIGDQAFNVNLHNPLSRRKGKDMSQCQVVACFRHLSRRVGFPVSPHRFRHTLGSSLANNPQANLFLVKEILGHSNIHTTLEYVEVDLEAMRAVLNGRHIKKSEKQQL
ncbi:MAG: site-specific integrase [Betaproteobacteria bacterium]|nr:site-specific integrase [Betaproteobacteria bacterium]